MSQSIIHSSEYELFLEHICNILHGLFLFRARCLDRLLQLIQSFLKLSLRILDPLTVIPLDRILNGKCGMLELVEPNACLCFHLDETLEDLLV